MPAAFLPMLGADEAIAARLVTARLWTETDDGYRIHDWADYQDLSLSEKRAAAGRKGGRRSGETRSKQDPGNEANSAGSPEPDADGSKQPRSKPEMLPDPKPSPNGSHPALTTGSAEPGSKQTEATAGSNRQANGEAGTRPGPTRPDPAKIKPLPSTDVDDEVARQFDAFWQVYPRRNGKRVGKANALIEWRKLTVEQRRRAYVGARNLAMSDTLPKDPERFLRRAKGGKGDYPFDDWQTPADVDPAKRTGNDLRAAAKALREAGR
ncbi:MAG: hypothetical protein ABR616_10330 [Dermatophilaceae bacterium]